MATPGGPSTAMATATTPLTQDYPQTASLGRHEVERLLAGWNPHRSDPPWYLQQASQPDPMGGPSSALASAPSMPPEEAAFEALIESLPQVKALRTEAQRALAVGEEKAQRNAELRPALEALRRETQMLYDRARALETEWPTLDARMANAHRRFAPQTLLFGLTQSANKLHDDSESLASAFVEGLPLAVAPPTASSGGASHLSAVTPPDSGTATPTGREPDVDATFVRRYRALRTTYHRRNLMADRWSRGTVTWRDD